MRPLRCLLILLCLLTACRPVNPTAVPAQTLPTATLTEMPAVTATPQPTITDTIRPSSTPTRLFTRTASPTATPAPLATATPIPSATPPGMARLPEGIYGASPDGAWLWSLEPGEETGDRQTLVTHIVSANGRRAWRVQPRLEEFEWGKASYSPLFWASTEPYVFLAGEICCADGPGTHYLYASLIRLDLHSGLVSTQIPWGHFHDFRFSPGGKYFNRTTGGDHSLHITRLLDGQSREIVFPDNYADISAGIGLPTAGILWSMPARKMIRTWVGARKARC